MPKKTRTQDQIRAMQDKAVRFLRDVVGDPEKAEEFERMSPEEYAEHKRIEIKNPIRGFVSILGSKGGEKIESSKNAAGERTYKIGK